MAKFIHKSGHERGRTSLCLMPSSCHLIQYVCVYIYATVSTGTRETAIPTPFYNSTIRPHFPIQTIPKIMCGNSTIWPLTLTNFQNTKTITSIKYIHPAVCFLSPSHFPPLLKVQAPAIYTKTHQRHICMYFLIPSN